MRLFEFTAPRLYLCTHTAQPVGGVVSLDEPCSWLGDELESILQARRPADRLPRCQSLQLFTTPQGTDYTYIVEADGKLERLHSGWLRKLVDVDPSQPGVQGHYAIGYWSGAECPEARGEPWEYRAAAVRVLSQFGYNVKDLIGPS